MKLSDKLAALEAAERASLRREVEPAVPVAKGNGSHATPAPEKQTKAQNKWSDAKRKVRDLVLAEIGPKLSGPKALKGPSLEKEVKACLDRIHNDLAKLYDTTIGNTEVLAALAEQTLRALRH